MLILAKNENYTTFKKIIFLSAFICISGLADAQKLYAVVKLTSPFSGLSYAKEYNKEEFRADNCKINGSWGIDLIYKRSKISHKLSLYELPFGKGFWLKNKFMDPPYSRGLGIYGFIYATHVTQTDQFALDYSLQKESKTDLRFLFNSRIRLN